MLKMINTDKAPKAIGPYSQAVRAGNFVFCSGQISIDPKTGELELFGGDAASQTELVLKNLGAVLSCEGLSLSDVVKTTTFLSSMSDFAKVNETYAAFFGTHKPARATVEVKGLPKGASIEIEAVAYVK